jgi:putative endonuclease
MFYVYVLKSDISKKKFYIGFSSDLRRRVREHNARQNESTRYGIPWNLVYYEAYVEEPLARERERVLKKRGKVWQAIRARLLRYDK